MDADAHLVNDVSEYVCMLDDGVDVVGAERSERFDYFPHPCVFMRKMKTYI